MTANKMLKFPQGLPIAEQNMLQIPSAISSQIFGREKQIKPQTLA